MSGDPKVLRLISESEFCRVEEVESDDHDKPMTREELIEHNQKYYTDLCMLLGKRKGKKAFDAYINGVLKQRDTQDARPTQSTMTQVTRLK